MLKVVAFGDNVVDCYADRSVMYPGGNALNFSVFIRRFGGEAAYVGAVGTDDAGRHIRDSLVLEGVDVSRLRECDGNSAFCLIGSHDGEREFIGADLGVSIIAPDAGDLALIGTADAVHTGRSSHVETHLADFAARTRLSFDFAVVRDPERIARLAPLCFLASFSGGDMSQDDAEGFLERTRAAGATWVLVTRGEAGALLAGPSGHFATPAVPTTLVDTLGAGDTFIARTLYGLLRGEAPEQTLLTAAHEAAKTCGHLGAFGHPAPMAVDRSRARSLSDIYGADNDIRA